MTDGEQPEVSGPVDEDALVRVYGEERERKAEIAPTLLVGRKSFAPWHHPVKQVVRSRQWAALTLRLLRKARPDHERAILRYFTLPGADLLDVRVLSEVCEVLGTRIEYFGFDIGALASGEGESGVPVTTGPWTAAESALRQAGRITGRAVILPDRLEDIAQEGSQAASQLKQQAPFDVINIDACDNLAFKPENRPFSTFDALDRLLQHQLRATRPWLLFITTRADPSLLGDPGLKFQAAINRNVELSAVEFRAALAAAIDASVDSLASDLAAAWSSQNLRFLKIFAIGLGKHLLHFHHGQLQLPADVELASVYAYRVHADEPDMLAIAFRITPGEMQTLPPSAGGAIAIKDLEVKHALAVVSQALKIQDLDDALDREPDLKAEAVSGTEHLLTEANYDIAAWRDWVTNHASRPLKLDS